MHSPFLIYFNHPSATARLNGSGTAWQDGVASNASPPGCHITYLAYFIEIQHPHISFVLLVLASVHVNCQFTLPAFRMRPGNPRGTVTGENRRGNWSYGVRLSAYALITRYIRPTDRPTLPLVLRKTARIFRSYNWYFGNCGSVLGGRIVLRNIQNASGILNATFGCGLS